MNQDNRDQLRDLFSHIKSDSPSMSFETNLMQRIRAEHKIAVRRNKRVAIGAMAGGVLAMIVLPSFVLYLLGWNILDVFMNADVSFVGVLMEIKIDPMMLSISSVCLVLLMVDTLVRRHIRKKEEEK